MKKLVVCFICLLFLIGSNAYARNHYVTAGGHFFAPSERLLDQALNYYEAGQQVHLWTLIDSKMIKVFPTGIPAEIYQWGANKIRVRVPKNSQTIWWTTKDAIILRGYEHLVK